MLSVSLWILLNAQFVSNAQGIFIDPQWKKGLQGKRESQNKHDHRTRLFAESVVMVTVNMVTYLLNCGEALF